MQFVDSPSTVKGHEVEIRVPRDKCQVAAIATDSAAPGNATFAIAVAFNDAQRPVNGGTPINIALWDAIAHTNAAVLTGASQYGWADIPGAEFVYVVRTDGNGGVAKAGLAVFPAN